MRLVYTSDPNIEVKVGDTVISFRGERMKVVSFRPPHSTASVGHVTVRQSGAAYVQEFYVSVFELKWVD